MFWPVVNRKCEFMFFNSQTANYRKCGFFILRPWPLEILTSGSCLECTTHTDCTEMNVSSAACRYPEVLTLFGLEQVQCSIAEAAPQDWLDCLQQSRKKKEKKKKKRISSLEKLQVKNESDKNRNKERIAFWCSLYSAGFRGGTKQTLPQTSLTLVTDVEMVISISHHQR